MPVLLDSSLCTIAVLSRIWGRSRGTLEVVLFDGRVQRDSSNLDPTVTFDEQCIHLPQLCVDSSQADSLPTEASHIMSVGYESVL